MNRIVISGPTGAVGMALIQKCIHEKIEVLALCRKDSNRNSQIPISKYVTREDCSLNEFRSFQIEKKYDAFYHFAWDGTSGNARNDTRLQNNNVKYTLDAVELASRLGCTGFIGAGSQAEYGRVAHKISPDTPTFPDHAYGAAKLCAYKLSQIYANTLGIKHIWARIFSIYGPYDSSETLISKAVKMILNHNSPALTPGEQQWDYLYAEDLARALFLLGDKGVANSVYCIGSGQTRSIREYMSVLRDSIDPSVKLSFGKVPYGENQVMHLCADIEKLTKDTGFLPETSFEEGIKRTIEWYRTQT